MRAGWPLITRRKRHTIDRLPVTISDMQREVGHQTLDRQDALTTAWMVAFLPAHAPFSLRELQLDERFGHRAAQLHR